MTNLIDLENHPVEYKGHSFQSTNVIDSDMLESLLHQKVQQLQLINNWITAKEETKDMFAHMIHRDKLQAVVDCLIYDLQLLSGDADGLVYWDE